MGRRFWWESEYLVSLNQTITIWLPINFVLYLYTPYKRLTVSLGLCMMETLHLVATLVLADASIRLLQDLSSAVRTSIVIRSDNFVHMSVLVYLICLEGEVDVIALSLSLFVTMLPSLTNSLSD